MHLVSEKDGNNVIEDLIYIEILIDDMSMFSGIVLYIRSDDSREKELIHNAVIRFLLMTGLSLALLIFIVVMRARRITRPIKRLTQKAEIISSGNLGERITPEGNNEITQLSVSFNNMVEQLQESYQTLEQKVIDRTTEVVEQRNDAEHQRHLVEEKNKEIMDSINYAKRIQNAILPSDNQFTNALPDSFVLYLPKDVVAGDFYWMERIVKSSPQVSGGVVADRGGQLMNLPALKHFRRELRNNLTPAEASLWTSLSKSQLDGRKFRRQHSIGKYIVDFYCPSEKLAIELDGEVHNSVIAQEYDYERDLILQSYGVKVIRFENKVVFESLEGLLNEIRSNFGWSEAYKPPRPLGTPSSKGGESVVLFAAADCTGHGVPGALVSVVCHNALNRAVREFGLTDPGKILDKTREIVIAEFEKSADDVKDGMDISLVALTVGTDGHLSLQWAGANNPLWLIRNGEVLETKPDKQPIGKYVDPKPFTTHTMDLQKGETIYIFTDGFQDQFGGDKGKKFKAASLKQLLLSIQHETMDRQRELLIEAFENWREGYEQIDDVCTIGVRV
jgi:very-short-patch-repair endonuclease/serine phosphatase RsbU (regulator of sigma subunit)